MYERRRDNLSVMLKEKSDGYENMGIKVTSEFAINFYKCAEMRCNAKRQNLFVVVSVYNIRMRTKVKLYYATPYTFLGLSIDAQSKLSCIYVLQRVENVRMGFHYSSLLCFSNSGAYLMYIRALRVLIV